MTTRTTSNALSRRDALARCAAGSLAVAGFHSLRSAGVAEANDERPLVARSHVAIRGIYGGYPSAIFERGQKPDDYGVNAVWIGSGGLNQAEINRCHKLGVKVFAEFNSMHHAAFLKQHPDAAPIGIDGKPSPPPEGWQGVSPFHAGYRQERMAEFQRVLETFEIDGIWLDYHHAHASWERDTPLMPDTDFSPAALEQFAKSTGIVLPAKVSEASTQLLGPLRNAWTEFRCNVFTDWVREYREILNATRPGALLGTFHCPWSQEDYDGAIRHKLAIDLPAQAKYIDVFSIMPYHARFGHPQDVSWISRQTAALGKLLNLTGARNELQKIWPIVQLADWGETVKAAQVQDIIDHGTRKPSTGVMVFHWSGVSKQWDKVDAMGKAYEAIRG
ncbi:hypothetical protein Pan44_40330 [Caulifigura coniformis]|uniref:Glycosyl hydrolase-like 10 domain-containing protein n=1 Tax=Caulifigura coniformis TaxID=2527983 RepID=A0A517SIL8_9PLAN|nr:hypothetical protein [Caulifigura coniformis]QDT55984.1 hypothetical protein Pan44_40330 [Caulifigura coniformis]